MACTLVESSFTEAAAEATSPASETRASHGLPRCVNSGSDIAQILSTQKANAKTTSKYDGYRDVLDGATDLELVTRLAYAETLAANCPSHADQAMDLIVSAIGNRIRVRRGDAKSVVFQRDQFASSLNIYPESRYRDFLCPTDDELWKKAGVKMQAHLEDSKPNTPLPKDAVNYYLYRHSDRLKAPDWKLEEARVYDEKLRECIRVFRNPAWK